MSSALTDKCASSFSKLLDHHIYVGFKKFRKNWKTAWKRHKGSFLYESGQCKLCSAAQESGYMEPGSSQSMCCLLFNRGEHWDDDTATRNLNYSQNISAVGPRRTTGNQYRTELDWCDGMHSHREWPLMEAFKLQTAWPAYPEIFLSYQKVSTVPLHTKTTGNQLLLATPFVETKAEEKHWRKSEMYCATAVWTQQAERRRYKSTEADLHDTSISHQL